MVRQTIHQMAREDSLNLVYGSADESTTVHKGSPTTFVFWYLFFASIYILSKLQGNLKNVQDEGTK